MTKTGSNAPLALTGRAALVTGSTSGIGLGIAEALARAGADVMLHGRKPSEGSEKLKAEIEDAGPGGIGFAAADLTSTDGIESLIAATEERFGRIDILVNNAGMQHVEKLEDFPTAKWDMILALNLSAAFHTTRLAFKGMKERGWGRIVNIASAHGLVASPYKSAYIAAKHGLVGLSKTAALEGAEFGITCNAICPGYVWTPLVEKQIEDQAKAHGIGKDEVIRDVILAPQARKDFATVEEIGALTVFLASDAGQSVTGTAMPVDGGWTAR